jgi:tetratricopeptide (TPR) repeat protein
MAGSSTHLLPRAFVHRWICFLFTKRRSLLAWCVLLSLALMTGATEAETLPAPELTSPSNGATNVSLRPRLEWSGVTKARGYRIAVGTSAAALPMDPTSKACSGSCLNDKTATGVTSYTPDAGALNTNTTYYWTVHALGDGKRYGTWAGASSFTTQLPVNPPAPTPTFPTTPMLTASATAAPSVTATGTSTPTPAPTPTHREAFGVTAIIFGGSSILEFITKNNWLLALLLLFWWSPKLLEDLIAALVDIFRRRGFSVEFRGVRFEVAEAPIDAAEAEPSSRSPFEIDPEPVVEGTAILHDLAPQIQFGVSDYVAQVWAKGSGRQAADEMRQARGRLERACAAATDGRALEPALVEFAYALERSRFLEAKQLLGLLKRYPRLGTLLAQIQARKDILSARNVLVLHGLGVAFAQDDEWADGQKTLEAVVQHGYLPAADTWLSCLYNNFIRQSVISTKVDFDANEFFQWFYDELLPAAEDLRARLDAADWSTFPPGDASNVGYYKREYWKTMGTILSMVAENLSSRERREQLFGDAERYLTSCTFPIDGEPASALDYSNLADLYRQVERYEEAHAALQVALSQPDGRDPIFYETRAMIFWKQQQPLRALLALQEYTEADARLGSDSDVAQYLENQMLAAKLASWVQDSGPPSLILATNILERAQRFLDEQAQRLDAMHAATLRCRIGDLLGYAYLQLPGSESRAVDVLECICELRPEDDPPDASWRRTLNLARARVRLSRWLRRNHSAGAAPQLERAQTLLATSEATLTDFPADVGEAWGRRSRHLRLQLDTLIVNQEMAEECFYQGELLRAQARLQGPIATLLTRLGASLEDVRLRAAVNRDLKGVDATDRWTLYQARQLFFLARIEARSDSSLKDPAGIERVQQRFHGARGWNKELDCCIDLELGQFLLTLALQGSGDVVSWYHQAVRAFERALDSRQPATRDAALHALLSAYSQRAGVEQRQRQLARQRA